MGPEGAMVGKSFAQVGSGTSFGVTAVDGDAKMDTQK